MPVFVKVLEAV